MLTRAGGNVAGGGVGKRLAWASVLLSLLLVLQFAGCRPQPRTLTLFIWPDYHSPELIAAFQTQYRCTVKVVSFSNNEELLNQILTSDPPPDVVVPSSYALDRLRPFLQALDFSRLPHVAQSMDYAALDELPGMATKEFRDIAVPYFVAPTGLAFLRDQIPPTFLVNDPDHPEMPVTPWRLLDQPVEKREYETWASRATLLDDAREAIAAALFACGGDPNEYNPEKLKEAEAKLKGWCEGGLRFNGTSYPYLIHSQDVRLAQAYLGDILPLYPEIEFALPEQFVITCDCLAIVRDSPNADLAHDFIDFMSDPKQCAKNMEWTLYRAPNREAYDAVRGKAAFVHPALHLLRTSWAKRGRVLRPLTRLPQHSSKGAPVDVEQEYAKVWEGLAKWREP